MQITDELVYVEYEATKERLGCLIGKVESFAYGEDQVLHLEPFSIDDFDALEEHTQEFLLSVGYGIVYHPTYIETDRVVTMRAVSTSNQILQEYVAKKTEELNRKIEIRENSR